MSQNKRKIEEYHDPDYIQHVEKRPKCDEEDKKWKILQIIRREFKIELEDREKEVFEIENRLAEAKRQLETLKFAAVKSFYKKGEITKDVRREGFISTDENSMKDEISLHPAIKKLIGKTPRKYSDLMSPVPTRKAAQDATSLVRQVCFKAKKNQQSEKIATPKVIDDTVQEEVKQLASLNSPRGRNQEKHLIVVGNTSKYIGENKLSSSVSHKWLVYVQTKSHQPLEKLVDRVCFFLHPTYQPNDKVDLIEPPYKISRFGWGEFTIRVQLYFRPEMKQKPVQIFHRVKLDERHTGLETLGAETMAELWLNKISSGKTESEEKETSIPGKIFPREEIKKEPTEILVKNNTLQEVPVDFLKIEDLPSHLFDHCYSRKRHSEMERIAHVFNRIPFESVRSAVEFLLRRLPLVSLNCPWKLPFISQSQKIFQNYSSAKKFSKEWFRAKFICRLLGKHPKLRIASKWSTKEIVIFARQYFYIPSVDVRRQASGNLQAMLKEEIKWEKIASSTTTVSSRVRKWISDNSLVTKIPLEENEIINVDDLDNEETSRGQHKSSELVGKEFLWNLDDILSERIEDLDLRETLRALLKIFLEDLLRRSAANVIEDSSIRVDHVKLAVLSRPEFDFLTNKNLGGIS